MAPVVVTFTKNTIFSSPVLSLPSELRAKNDSIMDMACFASARHGPKGDISPVPGSKTPCTNLGSV